MVGLAIAAVAFPASGRRTSPSLVAYLGPQPMATSVIVLGLVFAVVIAAVSALLPAWRTLADQSRRRPGLEVAHEHAEAVWLRDRARSAQHTGAVRASRSVVIIGVAMVVAVFVIVFGMADGV